MNRLNTLKELKNKNEKAFVTYITGGLPSIEKTIELVKAAAESGADAVELGVPFSDPVADGPVIQGASYRAILNGSNIRKIFDAVEVIRKDCQIPIVFVMYYNTLLHYGVKAFVEKCEAVGVDGVVIPDLPFEEQEELNQYMTNENSPVIIQIVTPASISNDTSMHRLPMILGNARGYVKCMAKNNREDNGAEVNKLTYAFLEEVMAGSQVPVISGFDFSEPAEAEPFMNVIDGATVSSHLIKLMDENNHDVEAAKKYIEKFKTELNK